MTLPPKGEIYDPDGLAVPIVIAEEDLPADLNELPKRALAEAGIEETADAYVDVWERFCKVLFHRAQRVFERTSDVDGLRLLFGSLDDPDRGTPAYLYELVLHRHPEVQTEVVRDVVIGYSMIVLMLREGF